MATTEMNCLAGGGGGNNTWSDTWTSSTTNETKTIELPFDAALVASVSSYGGSYSSLWQRNSTSDSWVYSSNSYITGINGREVTFKNPHGGTTTYHMYAMSAD